MTALHTAHPSHDIALLIYPVNVSQLSARCSSVSLFVRLAIESTRCINVSQFAPHKVGLVGFCNEAFLNLNLVPFGHTTRFLAPRRLGGREENPTAR
jgi:hypothetical protein